MNGTLAVPQAPRGRAAFARVRAAVTRTGWRYYLGFGLGRLAGLLVIPVVGHLLGPAGVGQFEVAIAVVLATAIVFDAGVGAAVLRFSGDHRFERGDVIAASGVVQIAAIGAAVVLFVPVMAVLSPHGQPRWALCLILAAFCVVEGFAVLGGAIVRSDGHDRLYLRLGVLRLVLTAALGTCGALAAGVPGALLGVAFGGSGFAWLALRRWRAAPGFGSAEARRRIARYGVPLIATTVSTWCLALSDRLFLRSEVTSAQLGQYAANYRLGSVVITFLAAPVALMWLPEVQRCLPELRGRLQRSWMVALTAASAVAVAGLVIVSGIAIPLLFGSEFHVDRIVVGLVAGAGWLAGLYYLVATPLLLSDSTVGMSAAALVAVVVAIGLNAILIPAHGAHGAAVATIAAYATLTGVTFGIGQLAGRRRTG
jgi:O-antigen/teichoic acid export membrane protein